MIEFFVYLAVRSLMQLAALLPLRAALGLGALLGRIAFSVLRIRRAVVLGNIRHVLGERYSEKEIQRLAAESYRQFGMTVMEVLRDAVSDPRKFADRSEVIQLEKFLDMNRRKVPMITCVPHCGNIDSLGNTFGALGVRYHVIMRPLKNNRLSELLIRSREKLGARMHLKGSAALLEYRKLLGAGETVVILPDQNARKSAVVVDFLGKPASTFRSPALLHLLTGAELLVATDIRLADPTKHQVRLSFLPPYARTGDEEIDVRAIMQRICDTMAETILEHPAQYFWLHRRWGKIEKELPGPTEYPAP